MKKLNRLSAIIALILIAAFILPSTAVIAAANDSNLVYFYGDLNANGEIDKFDYILIKRSCMNTFSLTDEQISRGDINNNGEIDKLDYILVKRHVMGTFTIPKVTLCEHELESINAKDATCDENGNIAYFYCVKCEKCYSDADATNEITPESTVIAAKGHDYTESKNDENGSWKECACGAKSETTAHSFGAWATVVDSTCTEQGTRMRVCITCGYIASEKLPLLEHTFIDEWLNDDETHWKKCACGAIDKTIAHTYDDVVTPPTESEQGFTTHTCNACGHSYKDSYVKPTASVGLAYTVNEGGSTCTVTGIGTCSDYDLIIPSKINGYAVTSIGGKAFYNCDGLTSINIPDSVISIGNAAFAYCDGLTSITIPDSVTSIGDAAFRYCSKLTSITIPDSVTSIGDYAFEACSNLTSITIPDSVTSIGISVFQRCKGLTSIAIPDSITKIGVAMFIGCDNLTSITIPNSVTSIYYLAFDGCDNLKDVYYTGSQEEWEQIEIGSDNYYLTSATIHYNSK